MSETLIPVPTANGNALRRRELGAFLRSRRERIRPEQVGLRPDATPPHTWTAPRRGRSARGCRRYLVHVARAGPRHQSIGAGARRDREDAAVRHARALAPV